jgi:hypothetical protein
MRFEAWNAGPDGLYEAAHGYLGDVRGALQLVNWALTPLRVRTFRDRERGRVVQFLAGNDVASAGYRGVRTQFHCVECGRVWPEPHKDSCMEVPHASR